MRPRGLASAVKPNQTALVTGGAGFIGCHLVDRLAGLGCQVLVYDSLARPGVEANLAWLRQRHPHHVTASIADIRDRAALREAVAAADAVFHLAAQVAVTTSISDPEADLQVNLLGTFNLLQALRHRRQPCIFASTNKVYGKLAGIAISLQGDMWRGPRCGIDERQPLDLCTPYGCSKGAADQYVLDYAASFDVPTAVMRMSCIYGPRQLGTEDQGWITHFLLRALAGKSITVFGDGCQVRDVMYIDDAVDAYIAAWQRIEQIKGTAFNLGGGPANAISLRQLIDRISMLLDSSLDVRFAPWRPNDQRWYVSNIERARMCLGVEAPRDWQSGIAHLTQWFQSERKCQVPELEHR